MVKAPKDFLKISKIILNSSLIILIWIISFYLATTGASVLPKVKGPVDLATVMSGTVTIALAVFSIFLAFASMYGMASLERKIRDIVQEETKKRLKDVENESRGRAFAILGYVIGESSVTPDFLEPRDEERLKEAISYCEQGYNYLKGTGLPVEFMALNNLLVYSCVLRNKSRRGYILEGAERLRAAAQEHGSSNLLLTYVKAILEYSLDPKEVEAARSLLADVSLDPNLNDKQKREAAQLTSLLTLRHKVS